MNAGFTIDLGEKLGFWTPAGLGFRMLSRQIGEPQKDDRSERVPFSNITYEFGEPSYGERTLTYQLDLLGRDRRNVQFLLADLRRHLSWSGLRDLHDCALPDYHFEVRAPSVRAEDGQNTVTVVTVVFRAEPAMLPNCVPALLESEKRYPDLNGDGHVTAADASIILTAAEHIAAGDASWLTPSQLLLADADLDGKVTEADALLVLEYASAVSAGQFDDNMQNWQRFLRRHIAMKGALY